MSLVFGCFRWGGRPSPKVVYAVNCERKVLDEFSENLKYLEGC